MKPVCVPVPRGWGSSCTSHSSCIIRGSTPSQWTAADIACLLCAIEGVGRASGQARQGQLSDTSWPFAVCPPTPGFPGACPAHCSCITATSSLSKKSYVAAAAKSLQSCPTLCDTIDGSPPGSPIPGILQARTLEWVSHKKEQIVHKLYTFENTTVVQLK